MIIAETDRLQLRTLEYEDIDALMRIWGDEEVMKYSGGAGNREREERALKFYINLQNERGFSPYAVILKENSELIGVCGFNPPYDHEHMELMYHFAKKYWGNGFATEAARACINYAREDLSADKLVAFIDPANQSSEKVLKKLGFVYKGEKWHEGSRKKEPYFEWKEQKNGMVKPLVNYKIVERAPTPEEYHNLCVLVGWESVMNFNVAQKAIENSLYAVIAVQDKQTVGMGRIVGDGAIFYYVQDIAVSPKYQKQGIGTNILDTLMEYIKFHAPEKAFVGLFAAEGTVPFYEQYGFKDYSPSMTGLFLVTPITK